MTGTPRIPKTEVTGIFGAVAKRYSKQKLGQVPDPLGVMWHNRPVLRTFFGFMAAVSLVGCSFWLDLGYVQAHNEGLDVDKAREAPRWRESAVFTPLEREVVKYAEAMTRTPTAVTDEMSERLLDQLGAPALVELTATIAAANMASRANTALGIEAQGFAAVCGLQPLATPAADVPSPA